MVTQKPISLKIDTYTLEQLDEEVALVWRKRNNVINEAIRFYLDYQRTVRLIRAYDNRQDKIDKFERFRRKWFPVMNGILE